MPVLSVAVAIADVKALAAKHGFEVIKHLVGLCADVIAGKFVSNWRQADLARGVDHIAGLCSMGVRANCFGCGIAGDGG